MSIKVFSVSTKGDNQQIYSICRPDGSVMLNLGLTVNEAIERSRLLKETGYRLSKYGSHPDKFFADILEEYF